MNDCFHSPVWFGHECLVLEYSIEGSWREGKECNILNVVFFLICVGKS